MKVLWENNANNQTYDISNYVSSITWSGSVSQASRSLEISVLYSPYDDNLKDININMGDWLKLYDDTKRLLINAMVYNRERVSEQGTISYSALDDLNRLLRSNGTYKFKKTTPENIVKVICKDLNIDMGEIAETKIPIKKLLVEGENYYNIIMKAYTKAYRASGKKYMPFMYNRKLHIIEKGQVISDFYLSDRINITSSNYSETIDSIVNKVKIFNDKGEQKGVVKDKDSISLYGIFQDVYSMEEDVNATVAAKSMLVGAEKTASIEALGNTSCISGYGVRIYDHITKLTGKFWIENDTHTWSDGNYTMSLELAFKNIMDIQEDK